MVLSRLSRKIARSAFVSARDFLPSSRRVLPNWTLQIRDRCTKAARDSFVRDFSSIEPERDEASYRLMDAHDLPPVILSEGEMKFKIQCFRLVDSLPTISRSRIFPRNAQRFPCLILNICRKNVHTLNLIYLFLNNQACLNITFLFKRYRVQYENRWCFCRL